jgi:thiol-disulfide isomerase/thioredoxin
MMAVGTLAVLYVLFAAASKPEQTPGGYARFATGPMRALTVMDTPPPLMTRTVRDAQGRDTNLRAFTGQVLVVNIWATWCAPCMEEMPTLGALQRRFAGRIRVVPVSIDDEGHKAAAQAELNQLSQNSLPFLIDITRGILFDSAAAGMPVTIIYDPEGREVARLAGGADWSSDEAANLMEAVLAEH